MAGVTRPVMAAQLSRFLVGVALIFQNGRRQGPLGYTSFGGLVWWEPRARNPRPLAGMRVLRRDRLGALICEYAGHGQLFLACAALA